MGGRYNRIELRLSQAEANGRIRAAFRSIRSAATRAEYRNQRFACITGDGAIDLNCADTSIAPVALFPLRTLRSLWSLGAGLPLRAGNTL
jgi:hypothetical protein